MSASAQLTTTVDRVFVKRTRRGQVKTHVRQTYLRDDLPSGSPHIDGPELEPRLSASATRYLVLDTNVVLHQIDLLERPTLCDVIVTQTVLDEVRHNKISVHKRLRGVHRGRSHATSALRLHCVCTASALTHCVCTASTASTAFTRHQHSTRTASAPAL